MTAQRMDPRLEAALDEALYAADPVARDAARLYVVQRLDGPVLESLVRALDAPRRTTRRRASRILSEARPERARPALVGALRDVAGRSPRVRAAAARLLAVLFPRGEPALAEARVDPAARVRRAAVSSATPPEALVDALLDPDPQVAAEAAEVVLAQGAPVPAERLRSAVAFHTPAPAALMRALAAVEPAAPALATAAAAGDPVALDHLADPEALAGLLAGPARLAAAWGLARAGAVEALAGLEGDPDPGVRAAVARGLPAGHPAVARLAADPDAGVAWLARAAASGAYAPECLRARLGPHARSDSPSARPPYGLRPEDTVPPPPRAHAALALCHTRFDVNLGVAVRTAEAAGLREVFLVGRGELLRSPARGTDLLLPVRHAPDPAALVRAAREGGYQLVVVQQTPASVPFHRTAYPPRPLFVLGAEDEGVPDALRLAADLVVEIPQWGAIDSLNVAAAATCVVFFWRAVHGP